MLNLQFDTKNDSQINIIKKAYSNSLNTTKYSEMCDYLQMSLGQKYITGQGGSHIWISDTDTGERLAKIIKQIPVFCNKISLITENR